MPFCLHSKAVRNELPWLVRIWAGATASKWGLVCRSLQRHSMSLPPLIPRREFVNNKGGEARLPLAYRDCAKLFHRLFSKLPEVQGCSNMNSTKGITCTTSATIKSVLHMHNEAACKRTEARGGKREKPFIWTPATAQAKTPEAKWQPAPLCSCGDLLLLWHHLFGVQWKSTEKKNETK